MYQVKMLVSKLIDISHMFTISLTPIIEPQPINVISVSVSIIYLIVFSCLMYLQDSKLFMVCQVGNEDIDMSYVVLKLVIIIKV